MTNQAIAKQFEYLVAALQVIDEKKFFFQIRSFQKAVNVITEYPEELAEVYAREKNLEQIEGIGPAIEKKIVELLETGKSEEMLQSINKMPAGMFPLLDIAGIGAKKAYKLAVTFHLTNQKTAIEELEKVAKEGKIRDLEKFGEKSEQDILESIERLKHSVDKMPYDTAFPVADALIQYLKKSSAVERVEPLGSLRRHKSEVGDIDIGLATIDFPSVKQHVKKYPRLKKVLADGENLIRILVDTNIQVDVKSTPPQRWGAFVQHFTGSKDHNIKLREYSLKKNLSLSEHGVKLLNENKKLVEFADEKAFYHYLGLEWIPPEKRVGENEIEHAKLR